MKPLAFVVRHRNALLLVTALGLGVLAAFGARGYIAGQLALERDRLAPRHVPVQVVVARRDLARGEPVSADTMAIRELPSEYVSAGAVTPERFDAVAGAVLAQPMKAGEPLLHASATSPQAGAFSAKVRSGIRALTIAVDEVNSMSGMLQPGDRIDLILSVRLPASSASPAPQELTRPLMQDVRVLATGRQANAGVEDRQARGYTSITIEVTPEQAQKLVVAQRSGKLTALLRNPGDHATVPPAAMDVYALLGVRPATPPAGARPAPEVIVGGIGALRAPELRSASAATDHQPVQPVAGR